MTMCQEARLGSKLDFGTIKISIIRWYVVISTFNLPRKTVDTTEKKLSIFEIKSLPKRFDSSREKNYAFDFNHNCHF